MISSLPPIATAAEQIRRGEISPLDLVEYCLARVSDWESQVHAWVFVDENSARREAQHQAELLASGADPGPLSGIPIGIKDIVDVADWPTLAGSPRRVGHVANQDAALVKRLRAAGAIILGKTVTTEFACFDPPPTLNPWNLERTPGGSSSGSAAAVALGMCMAAIGTQTGGSIVRPASYCGVAGLKPTFGHISLDGVVPVSRNLDHAGPIARCVGDLVQVFGALADSCYKDEHAAEPGSDHPDSVPRLHPIDPSLGARASSPVAAETATVLERLGQAVSPDPFTLPASFCDVHESHRRLMAVDAAEYHREDFLSHPEEYGPHLSALLEEGSAVPAADYAAALIHQRGFQCDLQAAFERSGLIAMPATTTTAPDLSTTGDPTFNSPWSYAGVPSITIPCSVAEDGLPCGLQLIGPRGSERRLLQAAAWCEEQLDFRERPSLLHK